MKYIVKLLILIALFVAVSRIAEASGFDLELINPAASSISNFTGISYYCAELLLKGLVAQGLLGVLNGFWETVVDSAHH